MNRAAYRGAVLVLCERGPRRSKIVIEPCICVQYLIADEFIGSPVKAIAAALGGHVHHATEKISILWAKVIGLYLELLNRILRGDKRRFMQIVDVQRSAVKS